MKKNILMLLLFAATAHTVNLLGMDPALKGDLINLMKAVAAGSTNEGELKFLNSEALINLTLPADQADIGSRETFLISPLTIAILKNKFETLKQLFALYSDRIKIDAPVGGKTLLMWAAEAGNPEIVDFLLLKKANPKIKGVKGKTAAERAKAAGYSEIAARLEAAEKEAAAEPAASPIEQLALAILGGNEAKVNELLATEGLNINEYFAKEVVPGQSTFMNPLSVAALAGKENLLELLLTKGAQVNQQNDQGETALHYAATYGGPGAVALLIAKGANPNLPNKKGETVLHAAVKLGDDNSVLSAIQPILAASDLSTLEAQDEEGDTALKIAEFLGFAQSAKAISDAIAAKKGPKPKDEPAVDPVALQNSLSALANELGGLTRSLEAK